MHLISGGCFLDSRESGGGLISTKTRGRCLVLGGAGGIGRILCDKLVDAGFSVLSVSRRKRHLSSRVGSVSWDLSLGPVPEKYLEHTDVVIHLAQTGGTESSAEKSSEIARAMDDNALITGLSPPVKRFISASSLTSHGLSFGSWSSDNSFLLGPQGEFGRGKQRMEKKINRWNSGERQPGRAEACFVRIANVYGTEEPGGLLEWWRSDIHAGRSVHVVGPNLVRNFISANDVAAGLKMLVELDRVLPAYELTSNDTVSLGWLGRQVVNASAHRGTTLTVEEASRGYHHLPGGLPRPEHWSCSQHLEDFIATTFGRNNLN